MDLPAELKKLADLIYYGRDGIQARVKIDEILQVLPLAAELENLPTLYYVVVALAVEVRSQYEETYATYLAWEGLKIREAQEKLPKATEINVAAYIQTDPEYLPMKAGLNNLLTLWRKLWFGARVAVEIKAQILAIANPAIRAKMEDIIGDLQKMARTNHSTMLDKPVTPGPDEPSSEPVDTVPEGQPETRVAEPTGELESRRPGRKKKSVVTGNEVPDVKKRLEELKVENQKG